MGPQLVGTQKFACLVQHGRPGCVASAGDVAGARVDKRVLASESRQRTRVDDGAARRRQPQRLVGGGQAVARPGRDGEGVGRGPVCRATCGREAGRHPGVEATIEDGSVAAQHAQHDHQAACGEAAGVVVGNHHRVVTDAERAHLGGECLRRGERMATLGGRPPVIRKRVIEIHPDGAGDVGLFERRTAIAAIEIPPHVGQHHVRMVQPGNGVGGDDRGDHGQHPASTFP